LPIDQETKSNEGWTRRYKPRPRVDSRWSFPCKGRQECTRKVMKTTLIGVMVRSILSQGVGHGRSGYCWAKDKDDWWKKSYTCTIHINPHTPPFPCLRLSFVSNGVVFLQNHLTWSKLQHCAEDQHSINY
jgi:hypothetical protein